jgi:hypothetical protein
MSLTLFLPGYTIATTILGKRKKFDKLLQFLLSYLFSILVNGLIVYGLLSVGLPVSPLKVIFVILHMTILLWYIVLKRNELKKCAKNLSWSASQIKLLWNFIIEYKLHIAVFACFMSLVFFFNLYLFDGTIVSDHWFHHGRALALMNGDFIKYAESGLDWLYPPFFSSFLSAFFTLSSTPSVNSYVSLGVLNIMPVLAFYYFFIKWIPSRWKMASLIAASFFILGGGLGWIHVLDASLSDDYKSKSPTAVFDSLHGVGVKSFDVFLQPTFGVASRHPDPTTGLILISLPAGFTLLSILRTREHNNIQFFIIIFLITLVGILTHDEFYLFIMIASTLPIFFRPYPQLVNSFNFMYAGILTSIVTIIFIDFLLPDKYYTIRDISGIPIIYLVLTFFSLMWFLYYFKIIENLISKVKLLFSFIFPAENKNRKGHRDIGSAHDNYGIDKSKSKVHFDKLIWRKNGIIKDKSIVRHCLLLFLIGTIAYLFLFSIVVWSQLDVEDVSLHISNKSKIDVPWYLFPIKFGLVGILGIAFLLSYLFKKFEKQVFIFGIIAAIAFLVGPYYDEFRFSKYITVGLIGFASIFVYMSISYLSSKLENPKLKLLCIGLLVGMVITVSSVSLSLFAVYNAMALDFPLYKSSPGRLDFPSDSEINLFKFILNNKNATDSTSQSYNIVTVGRETNLYYGLMSKFEGFTGLPRIKIIQNPLILNASSLEELYSSVYDGNVKLIVLPKKYVTQPEGSFPIRFVLSSFERIYEDKEFIVLKVPDLRPPVLEKQDIALVHSNSQTRGNSLPENMDLLNKGSLTYNEKVFEGISNDSTVQIVGNNSLARLLTEEKGKTLWTKDSIIGKKNSINYIESALKFGGNNVSAGSAEIIIGTQNGKEYSIVLNPMSLTLSETKTQEAPKAKVILARSGEVAREKSVWYTITFLISENSARVYLDDALKINVKLNPMQLANNSVSDGISKIGLRSSKNTLEFKPIIIGHVTEDKLERIQEAQLSKNLNHYFLISGLAFSKQRFDTFLNNDYSIFSKRGIILPFDSISSDNGTLDFDKYIDYVNSGGTLMIVMNASNNNIKMFNDNFGKLLQITSQNSSKTFTGIVTHDSSSYVNVSGIVNDINLNHSAYLGNTSIISSYVNDKNQSVAPLAVKRDVCFNVDSDSCGSIVLLNIGGYLDSVLRSPNEYFSTLSNFGDIIGLNADSADYLGDSPITSLPFMRAGSPIQSGGITTINSNSLLFPTLQDKNQTYGPHDLRIGKIYVSNPESKSKTLLYEDVKVKNLNIHGLFNSFINTNSSIRFDPYYSRDNYVGMSIPNGFNMTVNLLGKNSKLEIEGEFSNVNSEADPDIESSNGNETYTSRIDTDHKYPSLLALNDSKIYFNNVESIPKDGISVPFMMKHPIIRMQGEVYFSELYPVIINRPYSIGTIDRTLNIENGLSERLPFSSGSPTSLSNSNVSLQIKNIDDFYGEPYHRVITYINSSDIKGVLKINENKGAIEIMGDISQVAKERGNSIPVLESFKSLPNILSLIIIVSSISIIGKVFIQRSTSNQNKSNYETK